uniref:Uncharacterized protein n=1 Tax=Rhinopithecus bieti TaxID=61621 RepID=A0A2K6N4C6_RHIBE
LCVHDMCVCACIYIYIRMHMFVCIYIFQNYVTFSRRIRNSWTVGYNLLKLGGIRVQSTI